MLRNAVNKLLLILFLILLIKLQISAHSNKYGIIKGKNVNFRSKPSLKANKYRKLKKGEFVFYISKSEKKDKISGDEYFWYEIKTLDNKYGWIYGKYLYYLDDNISPEKYYKQILERDIFNEDFDLLNGLSTLYGLEYDFFKDENLIQFKYISSGSYEIFETTLVYEIQNGKLNIVLKCLYDDQIILQEKYVWVISPKYYINVYNRHQRTIEKYITGNDLPNKSYKLVTYLTTYGRDYKRKTYDSYLEFDEKTRIVTIHIRDKEGIPMRIERYKFKGGKFIKIKK